MIALVPALTTDHIAASAASAAIDAEGAMPNTPTLQDFVVDLFSRTVAVRGIPACTFSFYEYVHADDWPLVDTCWVTNPHLLPGSASEYAAMAKQAATKAGMTHCRPEQRTR